MAPPLSSTSAIKLLLIWQTCLCLLLGLNTIITVHSRHHTDNTDTITDRDTVCQALVSQGCLVCQHEKVLSSSGLQVLSKVSAPVCLTWNTPASSSRRRLPQLIPHDLDTPRLTSGNQSAPYTCVDSLLPNPTLFSLILLAVICYIHTMTPTITY